MLSRRADKDLRLCHACSPSFLLKIEPGQGPSEEVRNPRFWTPGVLPLGGGI